MIFATELTASVLREKKKEKKKIQNTHEIKRMLFNQTKQDGTCIFFFFFPGKPLFKLRTIIQQKTVEPTYHLPEQFMECENTKTYSVASMRRSCQLSWKYTIENSMQVYNVY